jgi:HSP20 family protein
MAEAANTLPTKSESKSATHTRIARSFETWRNEMEHFFDDALKREPFGHGLFDRLSYGRMGLSGSIPKIDIAEKDSEYEISAELPGMDEKDVEVTCSNGGILIKGEKKEESEEKKKDYFLSERRYGAFERYFTIPDGVNASKITADFKKGVLIVTLPKTDEAKSQKRKIPVKSH